jgi:DNA-binding transcriptional ArsR family regulator
MVEFHSVDLDGTFSALAAAPRREIISRLATRPMTIGELAAPMPMSFEAVSKHVRVLERAGLVRREVRGRQHFCSLEAAGMWQAAEWIDRYRVFWEERLDALKRLLESQPPTGEEPS